MNYENQTKRQLIKECKRLKRMINKKENNYVLLEKNLDCLQQSIANYVEIVLHQRKEIERLNNIINELKWKPIEEYDEGNYDWVLIKYFDGDYECIPIVAEKRWGKWYSESEKEIQFNVKYFMDMQQIDKLQELKGVDKE